MGAILSLDISDNKIGSGWGGSTDGSQALSIALKGNSTLRELNMSSNHFKAADAKILTGGISGNGALTSLDISKNGLCAPGTKTLAEALRSNQTMTALNISSNSMTNRGTDMSGVAALADVIPGMGALSFLDLSQNTLEGRSSNLTAADHSIMYKQLRSQGMTTKEAMAQVITQTAQLPAVVSIVRTLKKHAIEQQRACADVVGNEPMTKDLRALLVATRNLNRTLPALGTERLCQKIAMWL
jgi:Ran GTPase-activating protein (RanGAP) involved in mRNA processing and transport